MLPDAEQLAEFGLAPEDYEQYFDVHPENWDRVQLFRELSTQWRHGMSGPTGLDYASITSVFRIKGIPRKEWPVMFDDLREMEDEALKTIYERIEKR